jgi:hypothetical protein
MLREMQALNFKLEICYSGSEVSVSHTKFTVAPQVSVILLWPPRNLLCSLAWVGVWGDIRVWFTLRTTETVSVQFFSDGLTLEGGTDTMLHETSITDYQPTPHILGRAKISAARRRKPESWHSFVTVWTYVFRPDCSVALYYILQVADSDLANWLKAT